MKRLIFVLLSLVFMTSTLLAWTYTAQTSWNGSIHVTGTTSFTPSTTTAYVKMVAPKNTACPLCDGDTHRDYSTRAVLKNLGGTQYVAQKQCGGCNTVTGTVTTTETWSINAQVALNPNCTPQGQEQSWGPVTATATSQRIECAQESPGQ